MAKVTGPLLSINAKGTIASTQTYASWRGINYVRQRVIPANPRTTKQQSIRNIFANMGMLWLYAPQLLKDPWEAYAVGKPQTGRNRFIGTNVNSLKEKTDMKNFVGSIGARGGIPLVGITVAPTATAGELQVTPEMPAIPTGWVVDSVVAIAIKDQAPDGAIDAIIYSAISATSPYTITLTGLPSGALMVVSAWPVFTKPDGSKAYGPSVNGTGTPD